MIIYGIDVGLTGAIAVLVNGALVTVDDMPVVEHSGGVVRRRIDSAGLAALLRRYRTQHGVDAELAVIEQVAAMPRQGSSSTFSLGHSLGAVHAVVQTLGIPSAMVAPATWKRAAGLGRDKALSRAKASEIFPAQAGMWARAKDHNRAEAVLLAAYGAKQ